MFRVIVMGALILIAANCLAETTFYVNDKDKPGIIVTDDVPVHYYPNGDGWRIVVEDEETMIERHEKEVQARLGFESLEGINDNEDDERELDSDR